MRRHLVAAGGTAVTLLLGLLAGTTSGNTAGATVSATPSSTGEATGYPSAYQHVTDYDFSRCTTQVADAARAPAPTTGNVLDTGTFTGDPAGFSPPTDYDTAKTYGGSMTTVWDSAADPLGTGKYLGAAPWATAVDQGTATNPTRAVSVVSTHNSDSGGATTDYIHSSSGNAGSTWDSADAGATAAQFGTQLRDGRVLTIGFKYLSGNPADPVNGSITDTTGAPGSAQHIDVHFALGSLTLNGGFRVTGSPVQLSDGSVLQAVYGAQPNPAAPTSQLNSITVVTRATPTAVGSTAAWSFTPIATFGVSDTNYNYTEMGMTPLPDGSLIGVIRELQRTEVVKGVTQAVNAGYKGVLQWTKSTDGGATWSPMQDLVGKLSGGGSFDNGQAHPLYGIAPTVTLLPSGLIALSSGNNDSYVAYSPDGGPTDWSGAYTYRNCAQNAADPSFYYFDKDSKGNPRPGVDPLQWRYGSSGNTSLVTDGAGQMLQYGDNCQNYYWGCVRTDQSNEAYPYPGTATNCPTPAAGHQPTTPPPAPGFNRYACESGYTVDLTSRIWQRHVSLLGPDAGKIDLAALYRRDPSAVSGNMTWTSSAHPRAGVAGAFDGSTSYWSSAVADGGAGTMTIDLGKPYSLNRIGLSLRQQAPESATVQTSTDGKTFSAPVDTLTNATSYALTYQPLTTTARFVRINVSATSGCDSGLSSSCAFLNEVELYSTVDGFENDALGNQPRGSSVCPYAAAPKNDATLCQATVVSNYAASVAPGQNPDSSDYSHDAVRLADTSTTAQARVSFGETATATPTLSFKLRPQTFTTSGGALFTVGDSASGANYELGVLANTSDPSGPASLYNYVGGHWQPVAVGHYVPMKYWSTLTVKRTSGGATVSLNEGTPVAISPVSTAPSTLNTVTFSSSGTVPTGDDFMIDDVSWS